MSEASHPDDWSQMIQDCEERAERLTEWEQNFINSIEAWLAAGKTLTGGPNGQHATLDKIWEKVTK